jgi:hypothetical protein
MLFVRTKNAMLFRFVIPDGMPAHNEQFDDESFIDAVAHHSPASTREVSEYVGCVLETASLRLNDLAEDNTIQRKKVGRVVVWYNECE